MVVQADAELPVWGWADPGEAVRVSVAGQTVETTAGDDGRWRVKLQPLPAGQTHTIEVRGTNALTINNVLVGEVWLGSGQSNMAVKVRQSSNHEQEIAAGNHPEIRMFITKFVSSAEPQENVTGSWVICSPQTVASFSAVGYYFGRELKSQLNVPVGLIISAVNSSAIECWTHRETLVTIPRGREVVERENKLYEDAAALQAHNDERIKEWEQALAKAKAEGKKEPRRPAPIDGSHHKRAGNLYNGMIAPLAGFPIRGFIWYQGEANRFEPQHYESLFSLMIQDWRKRWGRDDLTFAFVQLSAYRPMNEQPVDSKWARLREAQARTLSLPNTVMAVSVDIGDAENIHPLNKQDVGRRLALGVLAKTYGRDVVYSGPVFRDMRIEGNTVRVRFDHVADGLTAENPKQLRGFAIAGEDRKFVWADARIENNEVVLSSAQVPAPVAVRYGWGDNPPVSLYNSAGLPACPFRTDNWNSGD